MALFHLAKVLQDPHHICKAVGLGQRDTVTLFRQAAGGPVLRFATFGAGRTKQWDWWKLRDMYLGLLGDVKGSCTVGGGS